MEQANNQPYHISILPDGNRRWARERGLDTLEGHRQGYKKVVEVCQWARTRGIKAITAFGFSTENWNRSLREVSYLMTLLENGLRENFSRESTRLESINGVKVHIIGQKERLPQSLQDIIQQVEEDTKENTEVHLNLAISYGGRWDILQAVKHILKKDIKPDELTEEVFHRYLSLGDLPDPDLFIRTGGEQRLSNFSLWQCAYTELYFTPIYWPDFTEQDFDAAIAEYQRRQRRFGH